MKFALDTNHLDFFEKNHYIEFNSLLADNELKEMQIHLEDALWQSARLPKKRTPLSADNQFLLGHDLSRHSPYLRKMVSKRIWAEIASQLIQKKTLRLGYDQLFPGLPPPSRHPTDSAYVRFTEVSKTLAQISSIQDVLCGLILCIKSPDSTSEQPAHKAFPLSQGNGIFIHPKYPIPFQELNISPDALYLLIAYINDSAVYILGEQDPHVHFLKSLDYAFGDKLKEKTHPVLMR